MLTVKERMELLRNDMKEKGQRYLYFTTADPHLSEYVSACYKEREYLSGFTGSNGNLLVGLSEAYLWTDGRYFVQAEKELAGSDIRLMKMGTPKTPTVYEFLKNNLKEKDILAVNGRLISVDCGLKLEELCREKNAVFDYTYELPEAVWPNRPTKEFHDVWILTDEFSGENIKKKLARVSNELKKQGATDFFLSKLDDIMWLFNLRGSDVKCNPVAYSYAHISGQFVRLFLKKEILSKETVRYLQDNNIEIWDYEELDDYLKVQIKDGINRKILLDLSATTYLVYHYFSKSGIVLSKTNMTTHWKSIKNETEICKLKDIYLKDSVALTKFLFYIKQKYEKEKISEIKASEILDQYRKEIDGFLDLSFATISAYGANGAMMHYEAREEDETMLESGGIYLVDSGGHYYGGTTDVTRSLVLGEISEEIKKHFTCVCTGMLRLQNARFLEGCTGRNLDILARQPLWNLAMDYKCGTGHGIGYMLNVHEGPQNISWQKREKGEEVSLAPGMLVSDEPGVYIAGSHGIRIENILLCKKYTENEDGSFLCFEPLTLVPIDLDGVLPELMSPEDREYLNSYHALVFSKVSPCLEEEEKKWLKNVTKPI